MHGMPSLPSMMLIAALALPAAALAAPAPGDKAPAPATTPAPAPYVAKDFARLVGMEGLSETLMRNHFKLYEGYVANANKLAEMLKTLATEGKTGPEYAELKRRFGWEWNGVRLHELFFGNLGGNLGGKASVPSARLNQALAKEFGSFDAFQKDFLAAGAMRGIGWVVLYRDAESGRLFNTWINEHDVGHLAGAAPLLVLDVFEHAFLTDYGLKRADYLQAFWKAIDWSAVEARMK